MSQWVAENSQQGGLLGSGEDEAQNMSAGDEAL
jgi:hypothetical protein